MLESSLAETAGKKEATVKAPLFKATMNDARLFRNLIGAISSLIEEADFNANSEGIKLRSMDPSHIAMVDFEWPKTAFDSYECTSPTKLRLSVSNLLKLLKRTRSDESVEIVYDDANKKLNITLKGKIVRKFITPTLDPSTEEVPTPKVPFNARVKITAVSLGDIIDDAQSISDNAKLDVSPEKFIVRATGELSSAIIEMDKGSDAILELGLSIEELSAPEFSPVLDRAERRLEEALSKGRVSGDITNESAEILSFPVSNLILSLVGEERARRRFALAESKRAYELLRQEDPDKLEYIASTTFMWKVKRLDVKLGKRLYDFALSLPDFLHNSVHLREPRWNLPNRVLDHGFVYVTRDEAARLMEEEVRTRILERSSRTPNEVPKLLGSRVERARGLVVKWLGVPTKFELPKVPMPEAMPPCVRHLIDSLDEGKNVQHMGRFTLASFLLNIGTGEEDVVKLFKPATDFSERMTRYQVEHIGGKRGGRTKYTCPMCTTLKTHGVCYKPDEICETIRNPLSYYKSKSRTLTNKGPKREPN